MNDTAPIYVWGQAYEKLVVLDTAKKVELAVITEYEIDTASSNLVVKLTPKND